MAMPRAKLTKLIITELAAVPLGAQEVQGTAILKRKDGKPTEIRKQSAMTTAVQGHQHLIYMVDESQSGSTSYESSYVEGQPRDYYSNHCHPWIRNADGTIAIGESLGHSHAIGELSASLAKSSTDEKSTPAAKSREVDASKSTRSGAMPHGGLVAATPTEKSTMDPKDQEIASLKKTLASVIALSSAEHAHYKTLSGDEQAAFLAKSATDRTAVVTEIAKRAEEADKVVYVSKSTGDVYKAKDDQRLVDMAKRMDEQAVSIEKAKIRKQATDVLGGMPGTEETHDLIVGSLVKSGAKQEEIDAALGTLTGMKNTSSIGKRAPGAGGQGDPQGGDASATLATFEKGLVTFAKSKNISNVWTDARAAYVQTDEGKQLWSAYEDARDAG